MIRYTATATQCFVPTGLSCQSFARSAHGSALMNWLLEVLSPQGSHDQFLSRLQSRLKLKEALFPVKLDLARRRDQ